jgi:hypothetical protein
MSEGEYGIPNVSEQNLCRSNFCLGLQPVCPVISVRSTILLPN